MVLAKNLDSDSDEHVPLVLGQSIETEIFQPSNDTWANYRPLLGANWNALSCLVQYGERVYHIFDDVFELNLETWDIINHGPKPSYLGRFPGKCAVATIDGTPGKILLCSYLNRYALMLFAITRTDDKIRILVKSCNIRMGAEEIPPLL